MKMTHVSWSSPAHPEETAIHSSEENSALLNGWAFLYALKEADVGGSSVHIREGREVTLLGFPCWGSRRLTLGKEALLPWPGSLGEPSFCQSWKHCRWW